MDEWMDERGSAGADRAWTRRGCGDNCQEKEREDGEKRDRLDGGEKRKKNAWEI